MDYTIKFVCKELGLTVHTVRYYCNMGLVPNLRHDPNGNRIFDETSVNWLRAVTFLRASGMSIDQIRHYFSLCQQGTAAMAERKEILLQLRQKSEEERQAAEARVQCLDGKINALQEAIDGKHEDNCNPLNW